MGWWVGRLGGGGGGGWGLCLWERRKISVIIFDSSLPHVLFVVFVSEDTVVSSTDICTHKGENGIEICRLCTRR